ncbi:hypothetical protein [Amycolatopsis sp. lyj-346]|uniref:hypothetical protein n=1 Tax=Amycolatopsis sp. lyj-346 TaxID=2789289 RepID=UPI00397DBE3C
MTTVQQTFPVPPQVLWHALPAGVAAIGGKQPFYDGPRGFATCRTGMSFLSWGQHVNVTVSPVNGGSTLTIMTVLKLGVFDWGEGKRLARRYAAAVAYAAGTAALT